MAMNKDIMITRQSQIKVALELLTVNDIKPTMLELLAVTDHLVQFVENGMTKDVIDKSRKVDEFINKKRKID
jgi:hypothetical protein